MTELEFLELLSINRNYDIKNAVLWLQNRYYSLEGIPNIDEINVAAEAAFLCMSEVNWERNILVEEESFFEGFLLAVNYLFKYQEEYQSRLNKNDVIRYPSQAGNNSGSENIF